VFSISSTVLFLVMISFVAFIIQSHCLSPFSGMVPARHAYAEVSVILLVLHTLFVWVTLVSSR